MQLPKTGDHECPGAEATDQCDETRLTNEMSFRYPPVYPAAGQGQSRTPRTQDVAGNP